MRTLGTALLIAATLAATACSKDDNGPTTPSAPTEQSLTGTWRATKMQYTNIANSAQTVEVVSQGTVTVLVLSVNGTFTFTITPPAGPPSVLSGAWNASTDVLTLLPTQWQGNVQFELVLNGNVLTLTEGHMPYDVNGDAAMEECLVDLTMARQ